MKQIKIDNFLIKQLTPRLYKIWSAEVYINESKYIINVGDEEKVYPLYHFFQEGQTNAEIEVRFNDKFNKKVASTISNIDLGKLPDQRNELYLLITFNKYLINKSLTYSRWKKLATRTWIATIIGLFLINIFFTINFYEQGIMLTLLTIWLIWLIFGQCFYIMIIRYQKNFLKLLRDEKEKTVGINLIADIRKEEDANFRF